MPSRDYWKGKRIAVIGLGPSGEMLEDVKFLIKSGALVGIYDLRSEARLKTDLVFLRSIGLAGYVCGSIPAEDLLDMDLILLSHEYPRSSSFLKGPAEKKIPIEYPETLFFKKSPPVTLIGIMGSCGKSTVISMLEPMLEKATGKESSKEGGQGFFVIDPESERGIISHLKQVKNGDIVLMRVSEEIMTELHKLRVSPHIAVFTTMPSPGSYEKSPFEILEFQTYNNFIIASDAIIDTTHKLGFNTRAKMFRTKTSIIPKDWDIHGKGAHDRENAALAFEVAKLFKVEDEDARTILEKWRPLKGRLEFVKKVQNTEFYNDAASCLPDSTASGVRSVATGKNVVLVLGGADSGKDYKGLYPTLSQHVHTVILLPGSGTMKERQSIQKLEHVKTRSAPSVEEAARLALEHAEKGDKVLFSPGFEARGLDSSRRERSDRFLRAVRAL